MFNVGAGEIALILVAALLVLGPKRLPELARGLGKFLREFRRQTDDVRSMVEREFYKMDQDLEVPAALPPLPEGTQPSLLGQNGELHQGEMDLSDHSRPELSADPGALPVLSPSDEEATVVERREDHPHPPVPGAAKLPNS